MVNNTTKTKVCDTCKKPLPIKDYHLQSYTGLPYGSCKACYNLKRSMKKDTKKHIRFIVGMFERCGELSAYSVEEWHRVMHHFNGSCAYCGKPQKRGRKNRLSRDHVVPITKGGTTEDRNIIPCCGTCNRSKNNSLLLEWYPKQPFYDRERLRKVLEWCSKGGELR